MASLYLYYRPILSPDKELQSVQSQNGKQYAATTPRTFVANEMFDGKMVLSSFILNLCLAFFVMRFFEGRSVS